MKINKDKNIGEVVFVVEGERTEFSLLHFIFTRIFDYEFLSKKRNKAEYFVKRSKNSRKGNSKIIVINAETSNVASINDANQYLERQLSDLSSLYGVDIDNSPIFYIFDFKNRSPWT